MLPLLTDEIMQRIEMIMGNKPTTKVLNFVVTLMIDDVGP